MISGLFFRKFRMIQVWIIAANFFIVGNALTQVIIDQDITTNTIWTASSSPYMVTQEIGIYNATLTIEPGVIVLFNSGAGLFVATTSSPGALLANGTPAQQIIFTSSSGLNNDWKGLVFDDRSDQTGYGSSLTNCIIEKAGQANVYGIPAEVYCRRTNGVTISQSTIGLAVTEPERGIYSAYCTEFSPTISNNTINSTGSSAAIYLNNNSSPGINNNSFVASGNPYWIFADQNNCNPSVSGNTVDGIVHHE